MTTTGYDIIGDIHGHADELVRLLRHLGYREAGGGFRHDHRKVVFLGDFIDRGEHLRQHRRLLNIVMAMVNDGHAQAVMGNHEFNALAFHTEHQGEYLRRRTDRHVKQHRAFLNEFETEPELKQDVLDFFYRLPLWLELGLGNKGSIRAVHACWHQQSIELMRKRTDHGRLDPGLLIEASTKGTDAFDAVETLLKGVEHRLPDGITFDDKDGHERDAVRVKWWQSDARCLGDVALPEGVDIGHASALPVPDDIPWYDARLPPCFVGHYWLNGKPAPLAANIACLDYSVAKQGKLVAYRWSGEAILQKDNFTHA